MSRTPEHESDELETRAIKPGVKNLLKAVDQSPIGGPLPRRGKYIGANSVEVPHFFGRPKTQEVVDGVEPGIGYGNTVIVYTQGENE